MHVLSKPIKITKMVSPLVFLGQILCWKAINLINFFFMQSFTNDVIGATQIQIISELINTLNYQTNTRN